MLIVYNFEYKNSMLKRKLTLEEDIQSFKLTHYKNADFDSFHNKTIKLFNRFNRVKDKRKQKEIILELYATYLQATEILFINAHALSVKNTYFPSALFIDSTNLRKFIESNFIKNTKLSSWFLDKVIFATKIKNGEYVNTYSMYSNLLKEVSHDYLENFDSLNAYKHGYRVSANFNSNILSLVIDSNKSIKLDESDSTITYYSKENIEGVPTIIEHSLNFKVGRVFGKCLFVSSLLNNMRATILLSYKEKVRSKEISSFSIHDKEAWRKTFGGSHIKQHIFSIERRKMKG